MVLSNTSRECTWTFELTDVHQCIKVDFPCCCFVWLFITSFHSFSNAAFASGINIAWGERSSAHSFGFPRQASLKDRSPELSWTIRNSRFPNIHILFLCTPPAFVCTPRDSLSRTTSGVCTSFFPSSHLRVSRTPRVSAIREEFCPTDTLCRATSTLKKSKIRCRTFFQIFSLERIRVPSCDTTQNFVFPLQNQYKWILLQTLRLLLFWNNGFPYASSGNTVFLHGKKQFLFSLILISFLL